MKIWKPTRCDTVAVKMFTLLLLRHLDAFLTQLTEDLLDRYLLLVALLGGAKSKEEEEKLPFLFISHFKPHTV